MAQENEILDKIKSSMTDMQKQMQSTYQGLEGVEVTGKSEGVELTMTCTYKPVNLDIQPQAMQGGIKEFTHRVFQALRNACEQIQKMTQNKTMELLQGMNIPDEIRNISTGGTDKDAKDGGSSTSA